jgi:uncharacterized protein YdeI (YjbR/CyaY-like superfamily)
MEDAGASRAGTRMPKTDPRVDVYIGNAAEFARPILSFLRETVHATCPDVEETIKWGMPFFMYRGLLCNMAAFKQHATFGFWKGELVVPDADVEAAMGHYGRITHCRDLPPKKTIVAHIRRAMRLNTDSIEQPKAPRAPARAAAMPDDLAAALALNKHRKAKTTFDAFSPSHRREYIEWITEAKRAETRQRRLDQTLEWLAEGKPRHWKYMDC